MEESNYGPKGWGVRNNSNKNKEYFIEKKISSPEGRFKLSKHFFNHYNLFYMLC